MTQKFWVLTTATLFLGAAACAGSDNINEPATNDDENDDNGSSGNTSSGGGPGPGSSSGGSGGAPTDEGFTRVTCPGTLPAAPSGQLCAVDAGSGDKLVIVANILAGDTLYEGGSVIIDRTGENGTLQCVGCDCEAAGATVLSCAEGVLSPGLINAHDHMPFNVKGKPKAHGTERFDHRHDWRVGKRGHSEIKTDGSSNDNTARQFAELRMLLSGVTSLVGSGSAPGLVRNLDDTDADGQLNAGKVDYRTFPLGDSNGTQRADGCNYGSIDKETRLSARIYLPHIAEGIDQESQNEFKCLSGEGTGAVDVIAANTSIVHGIGLHAEDIATIAQRGAKLVWSPRTNIDLYGQTADVLTYRRFGATIALGTDWILSGSMNMLRELACVDYLNQNHYDRAFSDFEIWRMATLNSAIAMGVEDRLGTIAEGYIADVALFDARDRKDYRAIIGGGVEDVALVMRGGKPLYGDDAIVTSLVADPSQCDSADVCTRDKRICAQLDTGNTLAQITQAANTTYPLFACGTPPDEPSCKPLREDEYTAITDNDRDGDGIPDSDDNCSTIFNPKRPLDQNQQPNADGDDFGDSCDVCPLNEGETCTVQSGNDRDNDGVPNDTDNCPNVANPNQEDSDNDGKGDACDKCPNEPNPGAAPCTALISEIKQNQKWEVGEVVRVKNALVVGSGKDGVFLHAEAGAGGNYSGLFAFVPGETKPAEGSVIDATGRISVFNGQRQIEALANITVVSTGVTLPAPTVLTSAQLVADSQRARELEGTLVRVNDVEVTAFNTNFHEATINGGDFLVDDILFVYPEPAIGAEFDFVQGPLAFRFGANRIIPRRNSDLVADANQPIAVASLAPAALTVPPNGTANLTINLNVPAGPGGQQVLLSATADVTVPATVTVPEGQSSLVVSVQAVGDQGAGTISANVTGQVPAIMIMFNVIAAGNECLIISEYVEGTSDNKAIEIYNCGGQPIDLNQILLCQNNRGGDGAGNAGGTNSLALGDYELPAGQTRVYCHSNIAAAATCDVKAPANNSTMSFNGNDSMYLVRDANNNGACNAGDPVIDAFGEIGTNFAQAPGWKDKTFSRCNFTPYLGAGAFDLTTYSEHPVNYFAGLGVAPVQGCGD